MADGAQNFPMTENLFWRNEETGTEMRMAEEISLRSDAIGHRPLRGRCPKRRKEAVEAEKGTDVKQQ